ncbi:sulfatase family protein [Allopusillimonas ginsengisoli]|uniref:sulfatase family protein n=1 Tax=Allopusillimonas ginsengisoli TaxID=453575 RepID=UPI0010212C90|nr:sulfatase-like hydrolase/transferase [Allopusillimonas ginsengisoli]TEA78834.1 twin-arginine translocation pathway signal protein [Allopusillimonas ginsengisoli]
MSSLKKPVSPGNTSVAAKPNLVFIMADDLGFADLGCYGGRAPVSPNLDALAAQGVRFTDAYANSPVCSPSRFALMTGRYQYRLRGGAEEPMTGRARGQSHLGLPPEHPTLPSLLRDQGYRTALIGKWHLGFLPHFGPLKSGYEAFYGPYGGGVDYFTHCDRRGTHDLYDNESEIHDNGYLTDLISERAVQWLADTQQDVPFMLSVHYTAPHWPWETRDDREESERIRDAIQHTDGGSVEIYQTMIRHMDEGIGRIMNTLAARGLDENTLIVFTSDNGGERFSDTWPLSGKKMDLLEGGLRVPLIVRWPARVPAGTTTAQVAMTMDWCPTMLQAAGVSPDAEYPLDGISLLPCLTHPDHALSRTVFWRMKHRAQRAIRHGNWKYLSVDGHDYLFDLSRDARERANMLRREPGILEDLRRRYADWAQSMPDIPPEAGVELVYTQEDMP